MKDVQITDAEAAILDKLAEGVSLKQAVREATGRGNVHAYREFGYLFFDVKAARYMHRKTKGKMVVQGSPAAYQFMYDTMRNKKADMRLRVRCAEFILNCAGHVAPKAPQNPADEQEEKDVNNMTLGELDSMLSQIQRIKDSRKLEHKVIDVTPVKKDENLDDLM